ncbi:hypothetical protein A3C87_03480 [Candidatus Kaiserbacteria bacterium RIFCSPHIGHO2_02_FULL_49_34]|uniref:CARDB domain-containing protein n=1 Tax=Candidatus Kaiserbacteria bacterium RIFCSPHIGHO2_02_FULL_49_34 TaxID=1798491 RepID=A0A1F6DIB1_9BACT|nr:MAG: hypothetical protein A3C87_03480 [Candidatus Kaiserbacteria bacterium RIFCSPHIGHO2_02_FULL_49_34]
MKYSGLQILGFCVAVILALAAAVFVVDAGVRGIGYAATAFDAIPERAQPVVVTDDEASARGEVLLGIANTSEVPNTYAAPVPPKSTLTKSAYVAPKTQAATIPQYAHAIMSYHAFGTIWRGSFVPRSTISRDEIPAIRAMVYNSGTVATNAWTFSCNWEGSITTTHQAPLGAGERAFAVCTTEGLSRGIHNVTLTYQETGKPIQIQTVSVRVD